jgi:3-phosphoshikimate 1-carboxyvinyltransferase
VDIAESSQFASALLLGATVGSWNVKVVGENAEESPYVTMTSNLIKEFPKKGGGFYIEPDASSGSYFWAAARLIPIELPPEMLRDRQPDKIDLMSKLMGLRLGNKNVSVRNWPVSRWQIDQDFPIFLPLPKWISRKSDLGDSIMMCIVMAPFFSGPTRFEDLGRLRVQETERVVALRNELTKCGARVIEEGDTLTVMLSGLHGAEIETYNDHRMAMCFAILGLKVPGIKLRNPACVKKTFPNFFQKLAASPPSGLGAIIKDSKTGRELKGEELFAE